MSMPAPPPDQPGGGSFFTQKFLGIPAMVWLGGAAVVAYLLFFRGKSGAGTSSSGGGGTSTTGNITLNPGATTINIPAGNPGGGTTRGSGLFVGQPPQGYITAQIPNGTAGWIGAAFPTQAALQQFYSDVGVTNGAYPNGLSKSQLFTAVRQAGGVLITDTSTGTNTSRPPNPAPYIPPDTSNSGLNPGQASQSGVPNPQVQPAVIPRTITH